MSRINGPKLGACLVGMVFVWQAIAETKLWKDQLCHCKTGCPGADCASNYVGRGSFEWGYLDASTNILVKTNAGVCLQVPTNAVYSRVWHAADWIGKGARSGDLYSAVCQVGCVEPGGMVVMDYTVGSYQVQRFCSYYWRCCVPTDTGDDCFDVTTPGECPMGGTVGAMSARMFDIGTTDIAYQYRSITNDHREGECCYNSSFVTFSGPFTTWPSECPHVVFQGTLTECHNDQNALMGVSPRGSGYKYSVTCLGETISAIVTNWPALDVTLNFTGYNLHIENVDTTGACGPNITNTVDCVATNVSVRIRVIP